MSGGTLDAILRVYDANGNFITAPIDTQFDGGTESATLTLTQGQWYIIGVGGFNGDIGSYNLAINGPAIALNPVTTPAPTYTGGYTGGTISNTGDIDWFQLSAPIGATSLNVSVDAITSSLNTIVQILDVNGTPSGSVLDSAGAGGTDARSGIAVTAGQTYYVGVTSFAGTGTYNFSADFNPDQPGSVDLLIDNLTPTGASVAAGAGLSVSAIVRNAGSLTAGGFSTRFYLSTNATLDSNDTVLTTLTTSSLAGSASTSLGQSVLIPADLPPGQYYLGVWTDYNDQVGESSNTNNSYTIPITITAAAHADLVIDSLAPMNGSGVSGGGVSINAVIGNDGAAASGSFTTRFYLSTDSHLDSTDTVLASITSTSLNVGGTTAIGQSVVLPSGLMPGTYYLGVSTDYNNQVVETNDNNNSFATPIQVHVLLGNSVSVPIAGGFSLLVERADSTAAINPHAAETWIVIHGLNGTGESMEAIADAVHAEHPNAQVLIVDWAAAASNPGLWGVAEGVNALVEGRILDVASALTSVVSDLAFAPSSLNLIGYSYGCYVAGELARSLSGVNSIVALDPARDVPTGAYDASARLNFGDLSGSSWSFFAGSDLGNAFMAATAHDAFVVTDGSHVGIDEFFASLLSPSDGNGGGADQYFALSQLTQHLSGLWASNQYDINGHASIGSPFEGVIGSTNNGMVPNGITFIPGSSQPEITVAGAGLTVSDGDSVPTPGDGTDFGSATLNGSPIQHTFTVTNAGNATLTTSGLTLPSGFTLVEGLSSSIAAGGSDTFTVQLNTNAIGTFGGNISFTTNDSDENPFNFAVTGTVNSSPAPEISVNGNGTSIVDGDTTPSVSDLTDFGAVAQGSAVVTHTFTVTNTGNAALATSGLTLPSGFSLTEGLSASIAPGASDTFTVQLNTTTAGAFAGNISFTTNDGNENPFNFAVTGTVNAASAAEIVVSGNSVNIADGDSSPALSDNTDFGSVTQGGSPITHTFTVTNTGGSVLTTSGLTLPSGFTLAEGLSASIAPGASDTFTVQLSTGSTGTFGGDVSFSTNDGDESSFNFAIGGAVSNPTMLPDLTPINLSSDVSSGAPGSTFTVSFLVDNIGQGASGSSMTNIYWSTDSSITSADTLLASIPMALISAGRSPGINAILTLPNAPAGTYYVGVVVDASHQVDESNESNNTSNAIPITLTAPAQPDLYVNTISGLPTSMAPGDSASLFYYIGNGGGVSAPASTSGVYLSTDNVITSSDLLLTTSAVSSIAANTQLPAINVGFTLPQGVAAGTYYVGVIGDYANTIAEGNESNNVSNIAQITVTAPHGPDLVASDFTASAGSFASPGPISVNFTVSNVGDADANGAYTYVYLSTDSTITSADILLQTVTIPSVVAAGAAAGIGAGFYLPAGLSGTYYIGAVADGAKTVAEGNESNNVSNSMPISIFSDSADNLTLAAPTLNVHALNGNDHVVGSIGADQIFGDAGDDTITGADGNDSLIGGDGADTLIGRAGADALDGGNGADTADYSASAAGVNINLQTNVLAGGDAQGDTLIGIENLAGSSLHDTLTGDANVNVLRGGGGNDTINGGAGNDTLIGGAGADKVTGGDGVDTASYATAAAGVTANLFDHTLNTGDAAGDIFSSIEVLVGSAFNDTLTGTSAANRLDGGAGADTMIGGAGADTYTVDNVGDVVSETLSASGGVDKVVSSISYTLGANLENLTLTGSAAINGTGNTLANFIYGNSAANTLNGGTGDDTLLGNGGHDILKGGTGADHFVFSSLNAADSDTISDFSHADDSIDLDNSIFTALGPDGALSANAFWSSTTGVAHDADDRVIYNSTTGQLYYDADGNGAGAAVLIATLTAHPTLDATDFFTI